MTNKQYALELINNLGADKALAIATENKTAANKSPVTYLYDEASFYTDQQGVLQVAKDQSKFKGVRDNRLRKLTAFWTEVEAVIIKTTKST